MGTVDQASRHRDDRAILDDENHPCELRGVGQRVTRNPYHGGQLAGLDRAGPITHASRAQTWNKNDLGFITITVPPWTP